MTDRGRRTFCRVKKTTRKHFVRMAHSCLNTLRAKVVRNGIYEGNTLDNVSDLSQQERTHSVYIFSREFIDNLQLPFPCLVCYRLLGFQHEMNISVTLLLRLLGKHSVANAAYLSHVAACCRVSGELQRLITCRESCYSLMLVSPNRHVVYMFIS